MDRKTRESKIFSMNGGTVSSGSRKSPGKAALSSSEGEYISANAAAETVNWVAPREFRDAETTGIVRSRMEAIRENDGLRHVLRELGFPQKLPTPILEDNESAIKLSNNPIKAGRSKHIQLHHHFIR